jgi:Na+-transporting NADH:ubiquinone oxidoreductase subunit NqrC
MDSIPQSILDNQSSQVDATSGATFTSIGIINAVNDALSQALLDGTLPTTQDLPQNRGHDKGGGERKSH